MQPFERLRYLARSGGDDAAARRRDGRLPGRLRRRPRQLVVVCRRLLAHHPAGGVLWWLCARVLVAPLPHEAADEAARLVATDRTRRPARHAAPVPARRSDRGAGLAVRGRRRLGDPTRPRRRRGPPCRRPRTRARLRRVDRDGAGRGRDRRRRARPVASARRDIGGEPDRGARARRGASTCSRPPAPPPGSSPGSGASCPPGCSRAPGGTARRRRRPGRLRTGPGRALRADRGPDGATGTRPADPPGRRAGARPSSCASAADSPLLRLRRPAKPAASPEGLRSRWSRPTPRPSA